MMTKSVGSLNRELPGVKEAFLSTVPLDVADYVGVLLFSGVLDRHPGLRFVIAESGIPWTTLRAGRWVQSWLHAGNVEQNKTAVATGKRDALGIIPPMNPRLTERPRRHGVSGHQRDGQVDARQA